MGASQFLDEHWEHIDQKITKHVMSIWPGCIPGEAH